MYYSLLQLYFCLSFLLKTTQVLISAIIVAACRTAKTAITASSEIELPLLVVVSQGVEYVSVNLSDIPALACAHKI